MPEADHLATSRRPPRRRLQQPPLQPSNKKKISARIKNGSLAPHCCSHCFFFMCKNSDWITVYLRSHSFFRSRHFFTRALGIVPRTSRTMADFPDGKIPPAICTVSGFAAYETRAKVPVNFRKSPEPDLEKIQRGFRVVCPRYLQRYR